MLCDCKYQMYKTFSNHLVGARSAKHTHGTQMTQGYNLKIIKLFFEKIFMAIHSSIRRVPSQLWFSPYYHLNVDVFTSKSLNLSTYLFPTA